MAEALFNTTYVCEQCMVKLSNTMKSYEVVKTEGIYDASMQTSKLQ